MYRELLALVARIQLDRPERFISGGEEWRTHDRAQVVLGAAALGRPGGRVLAEVGVLRGQAIADNAAAEARILFCLGCAEARNLLGQAAGHFVLQNQETTLGVLE